MTENKEFLLMMINPKKLNKQIKKEDVGGIDINVYTAYFDITWEDSENYFDYVEKLVDLVAYPEFHFPKCKVCKNKKKRYFYDEDNLINSLSEPFEYRIFICSHCKQQYKVNLKVEYSKYIDRTMCFPAKDNDDAMKYIEAYLNRPDEDFASDNMTLRNLLDAYAREQKKESSELYKVPEIKTPIPRIIYRPIKTPRRFLNLKPIKPVKFPKFVPPKIMPSKINITVPKFKPIKIPKISFKPIKIKF